LRISPPGAFLSFLAAGASDAGSAGVVACSGSTDWIFLLMETIWSLEIWLKSIEICFFLGTEWLPVSTGKNPSKFGCGLEISPSQGLPDIIEFIGVIQGKIGRPTFISLQQVHFHFSNEFPFMD
jgi:hypothetical protein